MKKKCNKKGKFINLNDYDLKGGKTVTDNNLFQFTEKTVKSYEEYETPLQTLKRLFPNFSDDIVESVYEENNRTYITTKKFLEDMNKVEESEEPQSIIQESELITINSNKSKSAATDIYDYARFKYEGDDPFIDDKEISTNCLTTNTKDMKKKKYQIDVASILSNQKKGTDDYISVFSNLANENTPTHKNSNNFEEFYLEDLTLDYYCEILSEFFPNYSRLEMMKKICDFDFDIDKLVLFLFDEKNDSILNEEFSKLELADVGSKEEVLSNFYSGEAINSVEGSLSHMEKALFTHNLQTKIEKEIKKNNVTSKLNNWNNEKDFPHLSNEIKTHVIKSNQFYDEYFLDKDIKDINTKSIREDLIKLGKNFIFTDEFELKWVYYQYMDYNETFKYFKKNAKKKDIFEEKGVNNSTLNNYDKFEKTNSSNGNNVSQFLVKNDKSEKFGERFERFEVDNSGNSSLPEILCSIISQNPSQWKIENSFKKINIGDYQTIRRKLIWQAQVAWRNGKHQDAKVIMAKARRYKQEINALLNERKIEVFLKNNESNSIQNFMSNKENLIDLHGLNYEESKLLINKKISDVKRAQSTGSLDPSRKFILNIITGVGNHSKDKKAVLLPRLSALLKSMKILTKVDWDRGVIKLYL
jgi:hypothetical protein